MSSKPKLIQTTGCEELAFIHLLQLGSDKHEIVETVEGVDPRFPLNEKAVIILSTQFGCPVGCAMCEAGENFYGNLTCEQILDQVRFVIARRPQILHSKKLKVHFARMGEPALNPHVLKALAQLPALANTTALMACISSTAPAHSTSFFRELLAIRHEFYPAGCFQLQFSVNSTDPQIRRQLMPMPHLSLEELSELGRPFHLPDERKIVLNFAMIQDAPLDVDVLARHFSPEHFMIKLTPLNPTARAAQHGLLTRLCAANPDTCATLVEKLTARGFETVISISEPDEIKIGNSCGQLVAAHEYMK